MAVTILSPHVSLPGSARSCRPMTAHNHYSGANGGIGGQAVGAAAFMAPGPSSMPLTIVPPPSVMRCSSAKSGSRIASAALSVRSVPRHYPKPPTEPRKETTEDGSSDASNHGAPVIEKNSLRLPRLPTQQNINPKSSSSDSALTNSSSNKIDSETSVKSNEGSPVKEEKDTPKGSAFPNFRILQRLATSARLRSAKKNAILHLNAIKSRRKSSGTDNSVLSDSITDKKDKFESATVQATGLQKAFDKVDHDSGVSSLESPTDTKDERGDDHGVFSIGNGIIDSESSTLPKGKRAKKKRPLSVKIRLKRRGSKRSSTKSSTSITFSTIHSGNITGLGQMMTVEPKKVEIYSSRYNKHKSPEDDTPRGVPQGSRSRSRHESNIGVRKSTEGRGSVTLKSYEHASTVYGSLPCQVPDTQVTGHSRRKAPTENKITKIFLSETQSSSIRDCGKLLPCAPPATPTPEMLKNVEYIPSLSDLRSQRAIKNRLVTMEKEAKERRQRRMEEAKKLEKQLQRDHVAVKKHRQRQEIYALNKVMTELENKNFQEFCKQMKNVREPDNSS